MRKDSKLLFCPQKLYVYSVLSLIKLWMPRLTHPCRLMSIAQLLAHGMAQDAFFNELSWKNKFREKNQTIRKENGSNVN